MEDVIGFVIFILIAVVSVIHKAYQQRQEKQQSQLPKVRPEDLPESTRRTLYGTPEGPEQGPRTAIPRQARPVRSEFELPTAKPRHAEARTPAQPAWNEAEAEPAEAAEPAREEYSEPEIEVMTAAGDAVEMMLERVPPVIREMVAPQMRRMVAQPPAGEAQRQLQKSVREAEQHKAAMRNRQQQLRKQQQLQKVQARQQRQAAAAPPAPVPVASGLVHPLLRNMDDVRRGIVLFEVLGPPRAFREF